MRNTIFIALATFLLTTLLSVGAHAYSLPTDVSGAIQSQDGPFDSNNNSLSEINSLAMFGFDDWVDLANYEWNEGETGELFGPVDIGLAVTPTSGQANSGTYAFNANVWNIYSDIIIVLKDGGLPGGNAPSVYWMAYLLDNGNYSGTWTYPEGKDTSHLSVYGRVGGDQIPEPATMLLFGTGLIGLAGISIRRKKK